MVARKLDAKLRDHLLTSSRSGGGGTGGGGGLFAGGGGGGDGIGGLQRPCEFLSLLTSSSSSSSSPFFSPPVLVILDRNVDLVPMLSHSWTYQALVHDVLDMKLNRVTVEVRPFVFFLSTRRVPDSPSPLYSGSRERKAVEEGLRFRLQGLLLGQERCQPVPSSRRGHRLGAEPVRPSFSSNDLNESSPSSL